MKDEKDIAEYLLCYAEEFIKERRYDDAILLYQKLVKMHPENESMLLSLAFAFLDGGRRKEAIDCFEQLLELELKNRIFTGFAFDELVRIFKETEDYDRLIYICERVIGVQPDDLGFLGDLADAYIKAGNPAKALEIIEKMAELDPEASTTFCNMGNALVAKGDIDGAEAAYDKAIKIQPSEASVFYGKLANACFESGKYEWAERVFRKSLEHKIDPACYCSLGDVFIKQGRFEEALATYEKAIELNRIYAGAYYNRLGNALSREHLYLQAIEAFKMALATEPNNPFYSLRLAELYNTAGLTEMAEEIYRRQADSSK